MTSRSVRGAAPLLSISDLTVAYGRSVVVHGVAFDVYPGEFVVLLGRNGSGKSTILNAVAAVLPRRSGKTVLDGRDVSTWSAHQLVGAGIHLVLERHRIFRTLSVEDNLLIGTEATASRGNRRLLARAYERFPELADKRRSLAAELSGGQQEMLAVAQGTIVQPKLLLLDEPSCGLSPIMFDRILAVCSELAAAGCAIVLVEQMVEKSLARADYCFLVDGGRVVGAGASAEMRGSEMLEQVYLGKAIA